MKKSVLLVFVFLLISSLSVADELTDRFYDEPIDEGYDEPIKMKEAEILPIILEDPSFQEIKQRLEEEGQELDIPFGDYWFLGNGFMATFPVNGENDEVRTLVYLQIDGQSSEIRFDQYQTGIKHQEGIMNPTSDREPCGKWTPWKRYKKVCKMHLICVWKGFYFSTFSKEKRYRVCRSNYQTYIQTEYRTVFLDCGC